MKHYFPSLTLLFLISLSLVGCVNTQPDSSRGIKSQFWTNGLIVKVSSDIDFLAPISRVKPFIKVSDSLPLDVRLSEVILYMAKNASGHSKGRFSISQQIDKLRALESKYVTGYKENDPLMRLLVGSLPDTLTLNDLRSFINLGYMDNVIRLVNDPEFYFDDYYVKAHNARGSANVELAIYHEELISQQKGSISFLTYFADSLKLKDTVVLTNGNLLDDRIDSAAQSKFLQQLDKRSYSYSNKVVKHLNPTVDIPGTVISFTCELASKKSSQVGLVEYGVPGISRELLFQKMTSLDIYHWGQEGLTAPQIRQKRTARMKLERELRGSHFFESIRFNKHYSSTNDSEPMMKEYKNNTQCSPPEEIQQILLSKKM